MVSSGVRTRRGQVSDMPKSTKTSSTGTSSTGTAAGSKSAGAAKKATVKPSAAKTTTRRAPAKDAPADAAARPATTPKAAPAKAKVAKTKPVGRSGSDPFLVAQRAALLAERGTYLIRAEELQAQADSLALEHEPGDVQFDEEGGEGGTSNVDRELDLLLSAQARANIDEIDLALTKMDAGTYGRCEQCGQPIPEARLEALPHASLCVVCKAGGLSSRR
jgi:DnaK suppressor protein